MNHLTKALLAAAMLTLATSARAVVLTPGVMTALPGTTSAAEPQLAGLVLEDLVQGFSFAADGGTISGTVQSRVVRSTLDGTLDFYWRVISNTASSGAMQSFRVGDFFTTMYNANWRIDGLGDTAPLNALLFAGANGDVNFEFGNGVDEGIAAGSESYFMFLDTSATHYAMSATYDLTNLGQTEISASYATFAPSAIPEPGSFALLGLGMGGLALARRRKHKAGA